MSKPSLLRTLAPAYLLFMGLFLASPAASAALEWVYGVKPGDTLISISTDYLIDPYHWRKLQKLNRVADPTRLMPGSKLRLPAELLKREAAVAEVIDVRGKVSRERGKQPPQALGTGARLQTGDTLSTGSDGTVSLRFVDGSRLLLSPNSSITLTEMVMLGKTGIAQTLLELHRGSLDTRVAPQQKPVARYEIKSQALNLAVRGTDFRAHFNTTDKLASSEVIEGAVQASGTQGKPVEVAAGFGTLAAVNQAPQTPQALPAAPNLSSVVSRLERVPLRFEWPAAAGSQRYRAQVFSDRSFERLLLDGVFQNSSAKWPDLPDGRYVLRVRSIHANGLEGFNADHEFVLKARPEPPFIEAPLEGQKVYGPEATLRWSISTAAQAYRVQLSAKPDFSSLIAEEAALTRNTYTVALAPGNYYWRVASIAAGPDQGPFSDVQIFTQRKIPESPKTEAPSMDDKHLSFRWREGEPGAKYQIQLAADASFSSPMMDSTVATNQTRIDRPQPGRYFMRIKTIDADGFAGPFGVPQQIEVPSPPAKPWWLLLLLVPLAM
jgi:hypothetical protein